MKMLLLKMAAFIGLASMASAATVHVNVGDNFFQPANSTIKVNDTVRWVWVGNNDHSTTSDTGLWNSGEKDTGQFSRQFPTVGTFPYFCTVHEGQVGSVVVRAAGPTVDPAALGVGVDRAAWTWTTGGNAVWINQARTTHDGVDAAQSGRPGARGQSWLETTATGPGTLRFWWRVSSEPNDPLKLLVNGRQRARISGDSGWQQVSLRLGQGTHTLRWVYSKNATVTAGSDRGWLDQVQLIR